MSADSQPFDRGHYEEALVELGLEKLTVLYDAANDLAPLQGDVVGYSNLVQSSEKATSSREFETTYRVPVIPDISPNVLKHSAPPEYLLAIFAGLVTALAMDANERRPHAAIPVFAPNREQLDDHIHSLWLRRPDSTLGYSFNVYSLSWPQPVGLEMTVKPHGSSIDYVNRRTIVHFWHRDA